MAYTKRPYEAVYNRLIHTAATKHHPCSLSYEDFLEFTEIKECHYCKRPIIWTIHSARYNNGVCNRRYNLDRKDNLIGYTKDNCVVACNVCNHMKGRMSYEEFIEQCKRVSLCH